MHTRALAYVVALSLSFGSGCGEAPASTGAPEPAGQEGGLSAGAAGRGGAAADSRVPLPWEPLRVPDALDPGDNPTTPEKVELGRLLFYDPILSADRQVACATCHSEIWGLSDGLDRSVGVGAETILAGPGRSGPSQTRRNAQTLYNVAFRERLFWDGRAESLEDQALFPLAAAEELGRDPESVIADIAAIAEYVRLFETAFPDDAEAVTVTNFVRALGAFQRTLISSRSLYDSYVAGDTGAMSEKMIEGMFSFSEAGCAACHTPPLFESDRFVDREAPPAAGVEDLGRYEVTGTEADRGAFLVPTLRNVRETSPYFHSGAVSLLDEAVEHEVRISVERGESRELDGAQVDALTEFLQKALVDRSRDPDRPEAVPSGLPVPLDNTRVRR